MPWMGGKFLDNYDKDRDYMSIYCDIDFFKTYKDHEDRRRDMGIRIYNIVTDSKYYCYFRFNMSDVKGKTRFNSAVDFMKLFSIDILGGE